MQKGETYETNILVVCTIIRLQTQMNIEYRLAEIKDIDKILSFYDVIIDVQKDEESSAEWTKDVYPSKDIIEDHIKYDKMYLGIIGDDIVSAGILALKEDEIYDGVKWKYKLDPAVIHLLAVNPNYRGLGYARKMVDFLIDEARKQNRKVIHLDALKENTRAQKMYEKLGFDLVEIKPVYYEDTGDHEAYLYELKI